MPASALRLFFNWTAWILLITPSLAFRHDGADALEGGDDVCEKSVVGSQKRNCHWGCRKKVCKCPRELALSSGCGSQTGERKFDPTKLSEEIPDLPNEACKCEDSEEAKVDQKEAEEKLIMQDIKKRALSEAQRQADAESAAKQVADEIDKATAEEQKLTNQMTADEACAKTVGGALARESDPSSCKCPKGFVLSVECGQFTKHRKFHMQESDLQHAGCSCQAAAEFEAIAEKAEMAARQAASQLCAGKVSNATVRESNISLCKCPRGNMLSMECSDHAGERHFDPGSFMPESKCTCQEEHVYREAERAVKKTKELERTKVANDACNKVAWHSIASKRGQNSCECLIGFVLSAQCGDASGQRVFNLETAVHDECACQSIEEFDAAEIAAKEAASEACGKSVLGAVARESNLSLCKCRTGEVLSEQCGELMGLRKFDPRIIEDGCNCESESEQKQRIADAAAKEPPAKELLEAAARKVADLSTAKEQADAETNAAKDEAMLARKKAEKVAAAEKAAEEKNRPCNDIVAGAVVRHQSHWNGKTCKCEENSYLSRHCGDLAGTRKFNPKAVSGKTGCVCQAEDKEEFDQDEDGPLAARAKVPASQQDGLAPDQKAEEDEDASLPEHTEEWPCKYEQIEGFKYGDFVRMHNSVFDKYIDKFLTRPIWYLVSFAWLTGSKAFEGKLAQVVCPPNPTDMPEARVCLRVGNHGTKDMGCWLPDNLEIVDKL